jgi:hypothetical protein
MWDTTLISALTTTIFLKTIHNELIIFVQNLKVINDYKYDLQPGQNSETISFLLIFNGCVPYSFSCDYSC